MLLKPHQWHEKAQLERAHIDGTIETGIFKGLDLQRCSAKTGRTFVGVTNYEELFTQLAGTTNGGEKGVAGLVERLQAGEVIRAGGFYIRKTPEAHRGLSKSCL